jgi:hypothetical protein
MAVHVVAMCVAYFGALPIGEWMCELVSLLGAVCRVGKPCVWRADGGWRIRAVRGESGRYEVQYLGQRGRSAVRTTGRAIWRILSRDRCSWNGRSNQGPPTVLTMLTYSALALRGANHAGHHLVNVVFLGIALLGWVAGAVYKGKTPDRCVFSF